MQLSEFDGPFYAGNKPAFFNRLYHVVERPRLDTVDGRVDFIHPRDDNNRNFGEITGDAGKDLFARHVRHYEVKDHHSDPMPGKNRRHLATVMTQEDVVDSVCAENRVKADQQVFFVIHHQHGERREFGRLQFFTSLQGQKPLFPAYFNLH